MTPMALARLDVFQRQREIQRYKRSYAAGANDRITGGWLPSTQTGDAAIQPDIRLMRDRARDREQNGWPDVVYRCLVNNVVGSSGVRLQVKARSSLKFGNNKLDDFANQTIEAGWARWGKKENCTVTGEDSWIDFLSLVVRSRARDGGVLIRKIKGGFEGDTGLINPFGYSLQLLEIDLLDINYTTVLPNGNYVFMGIEKNPRTRKPVRYHLLARHPGETIIGNTSPYYRVPYDASEIIHYFYKKRVTQSIGIPDLAPVAVVEKLLDRYEEAEVHAAGEAAMKGGFFTSERGMSFEGQDLGDGSQQENGNVLDDVEPGQKDILPPGTQFIPYDPKHPTDAFEPAVKHFERRVAAHGGISYASMTGDLKEANYSSLRSGKLDEQENFKMQQTHLITHVCEPIFSDWLKVSLLSGELAPLTPGSYDRYNVPKFRGRRWPWVDPSVDVKAALMAIDGLIETRTNVVEEGGGDFEELIDQAKEEKTILDDAELVPVTPQRPVPPPKPAAPGADPASPQTET